MDYIKSIQQFTPANEQEAADQQLMLAYMQAHAHNVLLRGNAIAHVTSSGFLMNQTLDKVLLVHHNIRGTWDWTGGHADGDDNLLHVAMKEAMEETGISVVKPLSESIASLDILPVLAHRRKGSYVNAHLHLSVAYILIGDEKDAVRPQPSENTGVAWFGADHFTQEHFSPSDVYLYNKLIQRALLLR